MKRYVVWFFILVVVFYEAFNILTHRFPSVKVNEQKEFISYLNELAGRSGISSPHITTTGMTKEAELSILSINIEMSEEFNKVINYINDIENSSFPLMIDNMSMHKDGKIIKTKMVLKVSVNDIKAHSLKGNR